MMMTCCHGISAGSAMAYAECIQQSSVSEPLFNASLVPTVWFDAISSGHRTFKLKRDLRVPVSHEDGLTILETTQIPIVAYGDTMSDALAAYQDHFAYLWDSISLEADENLTADALLVKQAQLSLVDMVAVAA